VKIVYSFNKTGYEAECWEREIVAASNDRYQFIPFNHGNLLDPNLYLDSVALDRLYQSRHPGLLRMYAEFESRVRDYAADAVIVTTCPPYHPDWLRKLKTYKVLYSGDDPGATYMRNVPYLHAYNHVMYMAPAYSADMTLGEKMRYCGMVNADWVPIAVFDFEFDMSKTEQTILNHERDIDIIYVGGFFRQKLDLLAKIKRTFGRRVRMYGFFQLKHNLYFVVKHGYPGWMRPVSFQERVRLYQRAKVGFNIHWNDYGLGNQRLFHLPANGVMQICDCPDYLNTVFKIGDEIEGYKSADELIDKLKYYLAHHEERQKIALRAYGRTMAEYRFAAVTRRAGSLIEAGMGRVSW
jgi:spore maturation protein CgeB